MENAAQYLLYIINPLVEHKEAVKVNATLDDRGVLLTLDIDREDMGRVIGRKGETAHAIRRLMRQYGMSRDMHIALKINEPA